MDILIILLSIFILGLEIALHELGHLATAKMFDVYCFEYSIGFGPALFKRKGKETQFTLRAIPVGGYVSMYGETDTIPEDFVGSIPDPSRSLLHIRKWKRAIVMFAGIFVNFVLALVLFTVSNSIPSIRVSNQINVPTSGEAYDLGLESDEYIVIPEDAPTIALLGGGTMETYATTTLFSGTAQEADYYVTFYISSFQDTDAINYLRLVPTSLSELSSESDFYIPDEETTFPVTLTFKASADATETITKTFTVRVVYNSDTGKYEFSGLDFSFTSRKITQSFSEVISSSWNDWKYSTTAVAKGIVTLFTPAGIQNVGGIVAVFQQTTNTFNNYGWSNYIYLWGFVSSNLALFNLLPFPGLDGWQLLVILIEAVAHREINPKVKNAISAVGIILLLALIVIITVRDVFRLF